MRKKYILGKLGGHVAKAKNKRSGKAAKIEVRRRVLDALGRGARVFDAFAGAGEMYRNVWREAASYTGCDKVWHQDERVAFVGDNRRVMRCIDLAAFDVFDLDAHGSPWAQALILAARRPVKPGERIAIVITDGSGLFMKAGHLPSELAELVGISGKLDGLMRWQDEIVAQGFQGLAKRMGCSIETHWQAKGATGASVVYAAAILRGNDPPPIAAVQVHQELVQLSDEARHGPQGKKETSREA